MNFRDFLENYEEEKRVLQESEAPSLSNEVADLMFDDPNDPPPDQPEEDLEPVEEEFPSAEKAGDIKIVKPGTPLYHGTHRDRAKELEKSKVVLAQAPKKSSSGTTTEGGLTWFSPDLEQAQRYASGNFENPSNEIRKAGAIFVHRPEKELQLLNRRHKLSKEEAEYFNKFFDVPDYKAAEAGTSINLMMEWRSNAFGKDASTYKSGNNEMLALWPAYLQSLGYDGMYDDSGYALIGDIPVEKAEKKKKELKEETDTDFFESETKQKIQKAIEDVAGELYFVGGCVRDWLMGNQDVKDIDYLVRFMTPDAIVKALDPIAKSVDEVGKSFGVITATIDGMDFDFAVPRVKEEMSRGGSHKDVDIEKDPNAPVEADLGRRDFTINAIAMDMNGNLIDPYGGEEDLKNEVINAVGDPYQRFQEDPLRMLRMVQFAKRFNFKIGSATAQAARDLKDELHTDTRTEEGSSRVPVERIMEELKKAWAKGTVNTDKLISILDYTGLGETLFGENFKPISIPSNDPDIQFMAFFLRGGDDELKRRATDRKNNINVKKEQMEWLDLARGFREGKEPWMFAGKHRHRLGKLKEFFKMIGDEGVVETIDLIDEDVPLNAKELALSGKEFIEYGFKGPQIGEAQRKLLSDIWLAKRLGINRVENTKESIKRHLGIEE